MELRQAYLQMIKAFPGGWDAIAAALGFSRMALENRVYERKGQCLTVEIAMQMQAFSGCTAFAEAVAKVSGGVYMQLPDHSEIDRTELLKKFNELYAELGDLSAKFSAFTADDDVDKEERRKLEDVGQHIHRSVEELLALTFKVFCKPEANAAK